jgi:hypothetical protein
MTTEKQKKTIKGEYKVVFKGRLLEGFDKELVIVNISRLTKVAPEKVEAKFFSGKVVIIRRAPDENQAQHLQKLFTQAGLEVFILRDTTRQISDEFVHISENSQTKILTQQSNKNKKRTLYSILAIVLWSVLIFMGMDLWNKYNIDINLPDEVIAIEQSLATKPLVSLLHINVKRLLSRHHLLGNLGLSSEFLPWKQLTTMGLKPERMIEQIIMASYQENEKLINHAVLLGQFPVNSIKQFLVTYYSAEVLPNLGEDRESIHLRISQMDLNSCQQGHIIELLMDSERILMTTDGYLNDLHLLLTQDSETVTDLNNWQHYRQDKLISFALFKPQNIVSQELVSDNQWINKIDELMILAQEVLQNNSSMDTFFAGVGLQLLPPAMILNVSLRSQKTEWLVQTEEKLLQQLENIKTQSIGLDKVQRLVTNIIFQQSIEENLTEKESDNINQLSISLAVEGEIKQSIGITIHELIGRFLTPSETDLQAKITIITEQDTQIDQKPLVFWPQYSSDKLVAFNQTLDPYYYPIWTEGPFALAMEDLLLESNEQGDQVVLQLHGKGQNIDNIAYQQAKLIVTEVVDKQDNNLLNQIMCTSSVQNESVQNEGFFTELEQLITQQNTPHREIEIHQKIKLKRGVEFSQVNSIEGIIELTLATHTQTKEFAKTVENKVIDLYDSHILFKQSADNILAYTISGQEKNVLLIRALNSDKEYLTIIQRFSKPNKWLKGLSEVHKYQGDIAFIEVVYAIELEHINYPFVLTELPPYPSKDRWSYKLEFSKISSITQWDNKYQSQEALAITSINSEWIGATWHDGPLNLAVLDMITDPYWGTTGKLLIKTPIIEEIQHNLSAVEIVLYDPKHSKNEGLENSYYSALKAKGYYVGEEFIVDPERPYMESQLNFTLPYYNNQSPLTALQGEVIIHLPIAKHNTAYTDLSIGATWKEVGLEIKLVRLGGEVMEFAVFSNRDRLLQITLVDKEDKRISTTHINYDSQNYELKNSNKTRHNNIILHYRGTPARAILTVSEGQQTKHYPFTLTLDREQ